MIKAIAFDIYGTILAINDPDNELPPRRGINDFLIKCSKLEIKNSTSSDAIIENQKIDLEETKVRLDLFNYFFQLDELPRKNFGKIIRHYKILPRELLVIGDDYNKDIMGAVEHGAKYLHVPQYYDRLDEFDFMKIKLI
jgi:FMN phosphatase YigB (HAD superfamily)